LARERLGEMDLAARDSPEDRPRVGGHPFFILRLVRAVQSGACEPSNLESGARIARRRLGRADPGLPEEARRLLEVVAVSAGRSKQIGRIQAANCGRSRHRPGDPRFGAADPTASAGPVRHGQGRDLPRPRARDRVARLRPDVLGGAPPRLGPRAPGSGRPTRRIWRRIPRGPRAAARRRHFREAADRAARTLPRARRQALRLALRACRLAGTSCGGCGSAWATRWPNAATARAAHQYERLPPGPATPRRWSCVARAATTTVSAGTSTRGGRPSRPFPRPGRDAAAATPRGVAGRCCSGRAPRGDARPDTPGGVRPAGSPPSSCTGRRLVVGLNTGLTMIDPIAGAASRPATSCCVACQPSHSGLAAPWPGGEPTSRRSAAVAAAASSACWSGPRRSRPRSTTPTPSGWSRWPRGSPRSSRDIGPRPSDPATRPSRSSADRCTGVVWELVTTQTFALWSLCFLGEVAELNRPLAELLREARGGATAGRAGFTTAGARWPGSGPTTRRGAGRAGPRDGAVAAAVFLTQHLTSLPPVMIDLYRGAGRPAWEGSKADWPPWPARTCCGSRRSGSSWCTCGPAAPWRRPGLRGPSPC